MKIYFTIEKYDKDGRLLNKPKKTRSKSFVQAFLVSVYRQWASQTYSSIDIDNTSRSVTAGPNFFFINGAGGIGAGSVSRISHAEYGGFHDSANFYSNDKIGLVVGSNSTAVTPTDYKLNTRITHGKTSGKLGYSSTEIDEIAIADPNASFDVSRIFRNNSGGM